jgi:integrase
VAVNVSADSLIAWRSRQHNSARTLNHYLQAMVSFLNWLERAGRIKGNPLKFVAKIDERGQSKRVRRAFKDHELRRLVEGAGARGIVYFTAARTGLRQEELLQLTWGDVQLDATPPRVRVRIVSAKNKKEEFVALLPEVEEKLRAHRPAKWLPTDLVFQDGVPRARKLRHDAESVGIPYCDESGRYADFHALRYTWATFLQRNGIAQRFAMNLLRHSDIKLTAKVYTDESQLPIYDAIKALPRLFESTQIRAQISGAAGLPVTQPVAEHEGSVSVEASADEQLSPPLTLLVASGQMERVKGIEPSYAAWEAAVLPLNYTRELNQESLVEP